jgi:arylsulfatase
VLAATQLPEPQMVNSIQQSPMEGTSMLYSFDDGGATERHDTQYFEMVCNRGIYHKGWTAVTKHRAPWEPPPAPSLDKDVWELYAPHDWTQAHDLAAENPEKLNELQRLWLMEAARFNVLPLDDRFVERINPELAGRPQLAQGTSQFLFAGMGRLNEGVVISIKNRSHSVTAEIIVPPSGGEGVIAAQGGRFGGWSLYMRDQRLKYIYNFFGVEHFFIEAAEPVPEGVHQIRMEFDYDGSGAGKGGNVALFLNATKIGEGRVERTVPVAFSTDETCDVGLDSGSPVSPEYSAQGNKFNGEVNWVHIDTRRVDDDRFVSAEARFNAAMARQ